MIDQDTILTEVTAEQWGIILPELEALLKTKQKKGETIEAYASRLAKMALDDKKVTDDQFEELDDITGRWVNGVSVAEEKGEPIPLPPSVMAQEDDVDDAEQPDEPEAEDEAPAPPTKKGKTKAQTAEKKPAPKADKKPVDKPVPTKKAKAEPAAKKTKPVSPDGRGRPSKYPDDAVIKLVDSNNPHRKGSKDYDKFKKLKDGQTIGEAHAAGVDPGYIRYLSERRNLITIEYAE